MEEDSFLQEEAAHQPGSWDQFAGNAQLIKQPTSYNELLYTTPIPENIPEDWCQKATLISTDQQTPDTGHRNDGDEETTHARVLISTNHSSRTTQPTNVSVSKKISRRKSPATSPCAKGQIRGIGKSQETRQKTNTRTMEAIDHSIPHSPYDSDLPETISQTTTLETPTPTGDETTTNIPSSQEGPRQRECPAENCNWKAHAHGGQWQSYYSHVAYRHGGSIPSIWWDNEGRFLCNECGRHYASSKKTSHENQCKGQSVQPASSPHPSEPLGETFYDVHGTNDIPSLDEICTTSISTCKDVPHRCRYLWTKILTTALSSAVHENSVRAWTLLAILPKCVLPAPYRGGRKAHTSYSSYILKRMELWIEGKYATLWSEAIRDNERKRSKQQSNENVEDKSQVRSELLVRQGEYSRGMAALTAAPLAPYNEETLQKLQKKHPSPHANPISSPLPPLQVDVLQLDESEVKKAVNSFHRGSSAGTMGLRPEHLQTALQEHVDHNMDPLMTLTSFVNHLLAGKAPDEVHPFFAGARLCALEKGNDDVRPIAAGETLRRLVSKAVCLSIKQKAGSFFGRKQYGVAAAAGAERVIHLCRRLMRNNMENDNITFCKVDLRNAFNNVSRPVFIFLKREHFPEISPWVEWCYGNHSCLTFGDDFIPSAEGVQQGDPLGPLLFSLALAEVTKEIASRSHLRTQLWYLDDGILVGEPSEVRKALDILDEIGPKCGLFLNLTKCEIITPPASAHTSVFFPDIPSEKIRYDGNFDTLGSPIGSAEHCMEFLETHAIEPARDTLEATAVLEDPQVALALIRQCAGFCQMVYALRTTPPQPHHKPSRNYANGLIHICSTPWNMQFPTWTFPLATKSNDRNATGGSDSAHHCSTSQLHMFPRLN